LQFTVDGSRIPIFGPAPIFYFDNFYLWLLVNDEIRHGIHQADQESRQECSEETGYLKAGHQSGHHVKEKCIYHQGEKSQAKDVYGQGQKKQHGSHESIQDAQHQSSQHQDGQTLNVN